MAIPVPHFGGLEGLTGEDLRNKIAEILRDGVAEGDTTTMDLLEDHMNEILLEDLKHDPCYEDEDTQKAIDLYGRKEWDDAIKNGINPFTLASKDTSVPINYFPRKSIMAKFLLIMKLAKEVEK